MSIFYYFEYNNINEEQTDNDTDLKINISENNLFELMMISNCLVKQYDIWKNNENIISLLHSSSNIIKNKLFDSYANIDEQTLNCISLSFYLYLYFSIMKNSQII
jgi:hypothetical protein